MSRKMLPFHFQTLGAKLQKNPDKYLTSNNQQPSLWLFLMGSKRIPWKGHFSKRIYSMPMQATFSTANNSRIDRNLSGKKLSVGPRVHSTTTRT